MLCGIQALTSLESPVSPNVESADTLDRPPPREAVPLPFFTVQAQEKAALSDCGEQMLGSTPAFYSWYGPVRWSDAQRMTVSSVIADADAVGVGENALLLGWRGPACVLASSMRGATCSCPDSPHSGRSEVVYWQVRVAGTVHTVQLLVSCADAWSEAKDALMFSMHSLKYTLFC